jgi:hypothetical protein
VVKAAETIAAEPADLEDGLVNIFKYLTGENPE